MNTIDKTLEQGKYLDTVFPDGIPSNVILNKTICGCGATYLELKTRRHSIIIEPNVPVIKGKLKKHSAFMFGVFEGVTDKDILKYLQDRAGKYKKIMTTPDNFLRIKRVLAENGVDIYSNFFLLFDECDRIVKDSSFRERITLPIADFFKFQKKAMVSATPIVPPDPRFELQNFETIKIKPNFPYQTPINLVPTNNIDLTLRQILDNLPKDTTVCIFFNSLIYINNIITELRIKDESNIYCSVDSVEKLKAKKYTKVFSDVHDKNGNISFNKYNFFTSRFYSALDIELDYKPVVIVMTDVHGKSTSLIDPATDSVQIAGRFRNGVESYTHITNYDNYIRYSKEERITAYLDGKHSAYTKMRKMFLESNNYGERALLKEALQSVSYHHYVTSTGEKDYFRHMNAILGEYIKSIYDRPGTIEKVYKTVDVLDVNFAPVYWGVSDSERRILNGSKKSKEEKNKCAYYLIHKLRKATDEYQKEILADIRTKYPLVNDAYALFGIQKYSDLNFNETELKNAVDFGKKVSKRMKWAIHSHFKTNMWYSTTEINDFLASLYKQNNIDVDGRGIADHILLYFDAEFRKKKVGHGWDLFEWQK